MKVVPNYTFFLHKVSEFSHPLAIFPRDILILPVYLQVEKSNPTAHLSVTVPSTWARLS
jgi:hypothetical protein